ncbi:MAG: hypothetical protein IMX01_08370 [Limnochordaceae bacterium]|nr:hypothetical protein [Limnochordaceae bacterium]
MAALVHETFALDSFSAYVFVFCHHRRDKLALQQRNAERCVGAANRGLTPTP